MITKSSLTQTLLQRRPGGRLESVQGPHGPGAQCRQMHLGRGQDVRGGAGGGAKTEQAVAVTGPTAFAPVAVDGGLQLTGRTQRLPLALVRVQILHIPDRDRRASTLLDTSRVTYEQILMKPAETSFSL